MIETTDPIDWDMLKAEQEAVEKIKEEDKKNGKSILDYQIFGLGQSAETYRKNGNFNQSRLEGVSPTGLFWIRFALLLPNLLWAIPSYFSCAGDVFGYWYFFSNWGFYFSSISIILTMLAARNPEWWHTSAFVMQEITHMANVTITLMVWFFLIPYGIITGLMGSDYLYGKLMGMENFTKVLLGDQTFTLEFAASEPWYHAWVDYATYGIITNVVIHVWPYVIILLNIYFTDVKPLKEDYKFVYLIGALYILWNFIGNWDYSAYGGLRVYPIIDW